MSEFSEMLESYVTTKKVNKYQMAKYLSIDRSSLHKIIQGQRNAPSKDLVKRMGKYLELSPYETNELLELYSISLVSPERYYPQDSFEISADKKTVKFKMSNGLRYCIVISTEASMIPVENRSWHHQRSDRDEQTGCGSNQCAEFQRICRKISAGTSDYGYGGGSLYGGRNCYRHIYE